MPNYYKESVCFGENNEYRIVKDFSRYKLYHKEHDVDKTPYWNYVEELDIHNPSNLDKALLSLFNASKKDVNGVIE